MKNLILLLFVLSVFLPACRYDESSPLDSNVREYVQPVVYSPSEGETVYTGTQMDIRWSGFKSKTVRLELWKKKQYYFQLIASKLGNTGAFTWSVPPETPSSVSYEVKLLNDENWEEYIYSKPFTIEPQ